MRYQELPEAQGSAGCSLHSEMPGVVGARRHKRGFHRVGSVLCYRVQSAL